MSTNLFQGQLDAMASPLLTRPAALPQAPASPAAALPQVKNLVSGLLGGLPRRGRTRVAADPLKPVLAALSAPAGRMAPAPVPRSAGAGAPTPAPLDTTLQSRPSGMGWVQAVAQQARAAGVPADLAVAIALEESGGDPRAVGDQGSSYGLYQLHRGGALGNLTPQQAFDPATNAGVVLRSWGRLGSIPSDPRAALMQYYSQVGRGSSNEIPTQRALAKLAQARQLLGQAPTGAGGGGGQTLAEGVARQPVGGGLSGKGMQALIGYAMELTRRAQQGEAPDPNDAFRLLGPLMAALSQPGASVAGAPVGTVAPSTEGGHGPGPTGGAAKLIGLPYQGTHNLGNWESDRAVDIAIPIGTPLYAVSDGTIGSQFGALSSSNPRMAGLRLHLDGPADNFYYAHMSRIVVRPGQRVRKGQLLGYSGSANGVAHLHFASERQDPRTYVSG